MLSLVKCGGSCPWFLHSGSWGRWIARSSRPAWFRVWDFVSKTNKTVTTVFPFVLERETEKKTGKIGDGNEENGVTSTLYLAGKNLNSSGRFPVQSSWQSRLITIDADSGAAGWQVWLIRSICMYHLEHLRLKRQPHSKRSATSGEFEVLLIHPPYINWLSEEAICSFI